MMSRSRVGPRRGSQDAMTTRGGVRARPHAAAWALEDFRCHLT